MSWPKWSIAGGRGDFLPICIGLGLLFVSLPAFISLLFNSDPNAGVLVRPLLVVFAIGNIAAVAFIVLGIQLCAEPGSLVYRIAHGRIFGP